MALFSFRHSVKTFSPKCETASRVAKAGQTAAHLRYITRASAAREVVRARLGGDTDQQHANTAEQDARKRKGRACERFIVALPVEASAAQRLELASAFAESLTQGRASYILAIHDKAGNDVSNPHFHLVAFDRHEKTGGRGRPRSVLGMARKNAVEIWAERWADIHNRKMREWGFGPECAISHLSFEGQGIDRIPEIHEGPTSRAMSDRGEAATSKPEWRRIDAGRTRAEANDMIREINQLTKEKQNESGNRLGGTDRGNQDEGDRRRPPFGKDGRRAGPSPLGDGSPVQNACQPRQGAAGDQQPPWNAGTGPQGQDRSPGGSAKRTDKRPFDAAPVRPDWPPVRRGRVRRVFLELILLRDTLRARLATLGGRRHALLSNDIASPQRVAGDRPIQSTPSPMER